MRCRDCDTEVELDMRFEFVGVVSNHPLSGESEVRQAIVATCECDEELEVAAQGHLVPEIPDNWKPEEES